MSDDKKRKKKHNTRPSNNDKRRKQGSVNDNEGGQDEDPDYIGEDDQLNNIIFSFMPPPPEEEEEEDKYELYLSTLKKKEKQILLKKEKSLYVDQKNIIPLKFKIINSNMSDKNKICILDKIKHFDSLNNLSSEYFKLKKYLDNIGRVPFGIYSKIEIDRHSSPETINNYLDNIEKSLDNCIYGQERAKNTIIEIIAKRIANPSSNGNIIGLCGPPGVGKTSLIKDGLSKSINTPFSFISLGGLSDSSSLTGFEYTYEGAKCGRIVEMLIENKCMNPIIFFDELDKLSETKIGDEITGVLMHLTDPSQNNSFLDKYFSGTEFDLSKAIIIFSFNDENKINPILKDRITIVKFDGFSQEDKVSIGKNYSIPKICKNIGISLENIDIPETTIRKIASSYCFEQGVRKLEQCLENILMKINIYDLTKNIKYLSIKDKIEKPYKINTELAEKILDPIYSNNQRDISLKMMYN